MSFIKRKDNLKKYIKDEAKSFLFTELDDGFLKTSDLFFMSNVPVPIKNEDLSDFTKAGLSTTKIADNMAVVIGADYSFKYTNDYLKYLRKLFDEKIVLVFATKASECFANRNPRKALCYLRAAMLFDENSLDAMFYYANGCRTWYLEMEGEDEESLISILKSDALEYFIKITDLNPQFAPAWYYLGFAYLNAGAYLKAQIAFKHYLQYSEGQPEEDIKEVKERMASLVDPVQIERGKDLLLQGRYDESLLILEPYVDSEYSRWWPLHFYLGTIYRELGYIDEAIEGFLNVLKLNPSNFDAMMQLSELYEKLGDVEKAEKYKNKAKLVIS